MNEPVIIFLFKWRFIFAGIVISAGLFLCLLLWAAIGTAGANSSQQANNTAPYVGLSSSYEGPNIVTGGMLDLMDEVGRGIGSIEHTVYNSLHSTTVAVANSPNFVVHGSKRVARAVGGGVTFVAIGVGRGIAFTAHTAVSGLIFVIRTPGNILGYVSNTSVVSAVARPSDHAPVVIIDSHITELQAAHAPVETASQTLPDTEAAWPINGTITTRFGVPHWPYQPVHTGLDISSGRPSGSTPVRPFKPGRVIDTVQSKHGLGNHVVVEHAEGIKSVYAHLALISVDVGQTVDKNTTLGYEGSTGASTGTHLHFEISVNGQTADPRQFISGQP